MNGLCRWCWLISVICSWMRNKTHAVIGNIYSTSCRAVSHHPVTDYHPITAHHVMFYSFINQIYSIRSPAQCQWFSKKQQLLFAISIQNVFFWHSEGLHIIQEYKSCYNHNPQQLLGWRRQHSRFWHREPGILSWHFSTHSSLGSGEKEERREGWAGRNSGPEGNGCSILMLKCEEYSRDFPSNLYCHIRVI